MGQLEAKNSQRQREELVTPRIDEALLGNAETVAGRPAERETSKEQKTSEEEQSKTPADEREQEHSSTLTPILVRLSSCRRRKQTAGTCTNISCSRRRQPEP